METQSPKSADALAAQRTSLPAERTAMAANRTMMAWVRTALALISFGFTIYKLLQTTGHVTSAAMLGVNGPKSLGLVLIALGTASAVLGSMEYLVTMRRLEGHLGREYKRLDYSLYVGIIVGALGLFLFITILAQVEVF